MMKKERHKFFLTDNILTFKNKNKKFLFKSLTSACDNLIHDDNENWWYFCII